MDEKDAWVVSGCRALVACHAERAAALGAKTLLRPCMLEQSKPCVKLEALNGRLAIEACCAVGNSWKQLLALGSKTPQWH